MKENVLEIKKEDFGPFLPYLENPLVTDIDFQGHSLWITDDKGTHKVENIADFTETFIETFCCMVANRVNKQFNKSRGNNVLEAETDTLRIEIVHESVALSGRSITIRKSMPYIKQTLESMITDKYCEPETLALLINCVKSKLNFAFCGKPGVGKTELLKFMTQFITDKAVTIEDNPEIHYGEINPGRPYQELKVDEERFSYTTAIKTCLRLNPKWILLSEARSEEVAYLLEAWSTGVSGMTTLHTDSVRKIPDRIVNMIGNEGDTSNIRNTVYEFLNVGILIGRRIDPDTNKRYRYINQMCFFAREFDTVAKVTKNRVYMVVEDGHIVSNTLPADVIKAMKKKYIDNPFKCKEVDAVVEKLKEGGADE